MRYLKINTLEKGWYGKDEVLLHAAFQLLMDFVEQERPDKIVDWNANELHRKAWKEIQLLYSWWKKERPARKSPLEDKRIKHPPLKFEKIPGSDLRKMIEPDKKKYACRSALGRRFRENEKPWVQRFVHWQSHTFLWSGVCDGF
jgi:hypothetical protein